MKSIFKIGDKKIFERKVRKEDTATFESGVVHEVYATFALARDAEWCSRLFALDAKEDNEEGIGTFVHVNHLAPAFVGEEVLFIATIEELIPNGLNCSFEARVGDRLVAEGRTGQKILLKEKMENSFSKYQQ